jgi:hypothetical protein
MFGSERELVEFFEISMRCVVMTGLRLSRLLVSFQSRGVSHDPDEAGTTQASACVHLSFREMLNSWFK